MLDDIAVRPFLEQPAGKDAVPLIVAGLAHVELHEGAGLGHFLPWRGRLAGAQPHNRIVDAQRLARLHAELAGLAIALVEQADHRNALCHRRAGQAVCGKALASNGLYIGFGAIVRRLARTAGRQPDQKEGAKRAGRQGNGRQAMTRRPATRRRAPERNHASGVQAS
jgi:hypothetical protein